MITFIAPEQCNDWKKQWTDIVIPAWANRKFVALHGRLVRKHEECNDKSNTKMLLCARWHRFDLFARDMYKSYREFKDANNAKEVFLRSKEKNGFYSPETCGWSTKP